MATIKDLFGGKVSLKERLQREGHCKSCVEMIQEIVRKQPKTIITLDLPTAKINMEL